MEVICCYSGLIFVFDDVYALYFIRFVMESIEKTVSMAVFMV